MSYKTENVKSILNYNLGGIARIWLLDIKHFITFRFKDDSLSDQCIVENIISTGSFFELESVNESNYTENYTDGIYKQKLSTFIYPLSGKYQSIMETLRKQKYIIAFQTNLNQFFCFGSDGGAALSFSQQTGSGSGIQGYSITFENESANSLLAISGIDILQAKYKYSPVFEDGVFCQLKNGLKTGFEIAKYILKTSLNNEALDINGNLCDATGLPQAIMLLEGFHKPEGNFVVESSYKEDTTHVQGYSIVRYNSLCLPHPASYISLSSNQIIFDSEKEEFIITLTSSFPWKLFSSTSIASFSRGEGGPGITEITVRKGDVEGNENVFFESGGKSVLLNIINYSNLPEWVLKQNDADTYYWNENGHWLNNKNWS